MFWSQYAEAGHPVPLSDQLKQLVELHKAAEQAIIETLLGAYPGHGILGEEFGSERLDAECVWVLDPIDGTLNYVATHRDWAISLALVDDGAPTVAVLADPVAGRLYTAIRGRGAWVQPLLAGAAGTDDRAARAAGLGRHGRRRHGAARAG